MTVRGVQRNLVSLILTVPFLSSFSGCCDGDIEVVPGACPSRMVSPMDHRSPEDISQPHMLSPGHANGPLLLSKVPLSFWGGTDPSTGAIVDTHHDLHNHSMKGKILALPSARGSCSGSLALLECIVAGNGPNGIILGQPDHIIALGALVAGTLFDMPLPIVVVGQEKYDQLQDGSDVRIDTRKSMVHFRNPDRTNSYIHLRTSSDQQVELSEMDEAMLSGSKGECLQKAMELVVSMARMYGAKRLIDITNAHIDACIYVGPASLEFAERFKDLGGRFMVPTTLNSISVDQRKWEQLGVNPEQAIGACKLAEAYRSMGAVESFTCAPYLLPNHPTSGDQIGWAESNAVVFANSVLNARTQKYPDMLDVVVALTGRAPLAGCHLDEERLPTVRVDIDPRLAQVTDDLVWPLMGYRIGAEAGNEVVIVYGLEKSKPTMDDLKAFSAAYGTTSASPMFHIHGITPQAVDLNVDPKTFRTVHLTLGDCAASWKELNSALSFPNDTVDLVALGNPHLSLEEIGTLASNTNGNRRSLNTGIILTCGRHVHERAEEKGYLKILEDFGAEVLTDTCWCMIERPIIGDDVKSIMTNSAKYAHYGPGKSGKVMHFGNLKACIDAAVTGRNHSMGLPAWLIP